MKTLLTILVLFSAQVFAQNLDTGDLQDSSDIQALEENGDEEVYPQEEQASDETTTNESQDKTSDSPIKVECQCPPPAQNEEAPVNSVFPPNSVFFMAPQPAPVPQTEEAPANPNTPPGYGGKMNSGYSDDSYKQIQ